MEIGEIMYDFEDEKDLRLERSVVVGMSEHNIRNCHQLIARIQAHMIV
jgi:hypothetical protein